MKSGRFGIAAALVLTALAVAGAAASYRRTQPSPPAPLLGRRPVPAPAAGKTIRELSAGDDQTCALYTNGTVVWCALREGHRRGHRPSPCRDVLDTFGDTTCGVGSEDEELHCWGEMSATVSWFGDPVGPRLFHSGPRDFVGLRGRFEPHAHAGAVELMTSTTGVTCARFADNRARCWSDGITNGEG